MSDRYKLNETRSPIDPSSWRELNQNWDLIQSYLRFLERQIKFLAGGKEIDEILIRIDTAIENAENATGDAEAAKREVENALQQLEVLVISTQNAANNANNAARDANTLNTALTALKRELETLQTNLNSIVQSEAQRLSAENTRRENEAARSLKEQARESAEQQRNTTFDSKMTEADEKTATMQDLIRNLVSYSYAPETTYVFPNLVKWNGSTFIALRRVKGITPVDDGVNYRLVAKKGDKGDTGAGINVLGRFNDTSELPTTGSIGDAYIIGINLYVWGGTDWVDGGPIQGPKGDSATSTTFLDFVINASDSTQVALSSGVTINPTGYSYNANTDTFEVYRNSRILYPGSDYTIENGSIRVAQSVTEPDKTTFYIRVTRVVYRIDEDAGRETIVNALGYTPANNTNLSEVDQRLTTQLAQTDSKLVFLETEKADKSEIDGTNLRIDNLVIPLSPENVNIEVTDAQVSVPKAKTFPSLTKRIEEAENDTLRLESANLQLINKFANSNVPTQETFTSSANRIHIKPDGTWFKTTSTGYNGTTRQAIPIVQGHKYFAKMKIKDSSTAKLGRFFALLYSDESRDTEGSSANAAENNIYSGIITATKTGDANVYFVNTSNNSYNLGNMIRDYQLFIPLTEIYGLGNEPTVEEMETTLASLPSEWFSGKNPIGSKVLINELKKAKNEPATSSKRTSLGELPLVTFSDSGSVMNLDTVNRKIVFTGITYIFHRNKRYTIPAETEIDFSTIPVTGIVIYFNIETQTFDLRSQTAMSSVAESNIMFAVAYRLNGVWKLTVNGDYTVNGDPLYEPFGGTRITPTYQFSLEKVYGSPSNSDFYGIGDVGSPFDYTNDTHTKVYSLFDDLQSEHSNYITRTEEGIVTNDIPVYEYAFRPTRTQFSTLKPFPKLLIGASVHGGEGLAVATLYYVMKRICEESDTDERLAYLRNNLNIHVVPLRNPGAYNEKSYVYPNGVNINRNFSYGWNNSSDTTKGTSPFSELETQVQRDWLIENQDAFFQLDLHVRGGRQLVDDERIMWLSCSTDEQIQIGAQAIENITRRYHKKIPILQTAPILGYVSKGEANGTLRSYSYRELNIPTITWEGFSRSTTLSTMENSDVVNLNVDFLLETMLAVVKKYQ